MFLLMITGLITFKGFRDREFFEEYAFEVDPILIDGEWKRVISSGLLHVSWLHFGFNMVALLSFSYSLELLFGAWKFLALYFFSMIGGSLLSLHMHRNHGDYRAVGASGAISGVVFAAIMLDPNGSISLFGLPFSIKSWIFGLAFVLISIFGIKRQADNIGHDAHLGGALAGLMGILFLKPTLALDHWWVLLLLALPTMAFLFLIIRNPAVLMVDNYWGETLSRRRWHDRRQNNSLSPEDEMDQLLDKIRRQGMASLTKKERQRLKELREELR
ncbi:MAG: rhomboid family intramembrane serine protease [Phaeodactylibacter sp.]|nr:rhomboid family intramembrane serine protease [Phaeodactylibacter sp.]